MDEESGGLVLNIGAFGKPKLNAKFKFKGNKRDRIKARRLEKRRKQLEINSESTQHFEHNVLDSKKRKIEDGKQQNLSPKNADLTDDEEVHNKANRQHDHKGHPAARDTNKVFISSLFKYNPDIPKVEKSEVKVIKEEVFSTTSFKDLQLHPHLTSTLEERMKLTQMTRVQQLAIPRVMESKDVLVKSQTGAGKTLCYAIPIVQDLQGRQPKVQRNDGVHAIIIVPSRELALQVHKSFQDLVYPFQWIVPGYLIGGEKTKAQKARLRKGMNILVATPGRLIYHMEHTASLSLTNVQWLVLDEADRMLDMGYEKEVAKILTKLHNVKTSDRVQTILVSATLTEGVERLAGISLTDPVIIDAVTNGHTSTQRTKLDEGIKAENLKDFVLPEKLKQHFVITPCKLRLVTLAAFMLAKCKFSSHPGKMIVFLSTQVAVEFHYQLFRYFFGGGSQELLEEEAEGEDDSVMFFKLHGDMEQTERTNVFHSFCSAASGVLLCTDVASRGLHLPHVQWIVQYTTPGEATEYIHRVGRTARAGKKGNSLLFVMPSEVEYVKTLQGFGISMMELQMTDVLQTLIVAVRDVGSTTETQRQLPRTYEEAATYLQMCFENHMVEHSKMHKLATKAYQSFIRAYATYPSSLKSIFHVKYLHLGHLAKSFGLREAPADIGRSAKKGDHSKGAGRKYKQLDDRSRAKGKPHPSFSSFNVSEFSSGLSKGKVTKHKIRAKKKKHIPKIK